MENEFRLLGRQGVATTTLPSPLSRGPTDFLGIPACSGSQCLLYNTRQARWRVSSPSLDCELLEGRAMCCAIH